MSTTRDSLLSATTWSVLVIGVAGTALGAWVLLPFDELAVSEERLQFVGLTYALFYYLLFEIWRLARQQTWRVLVQPVVLASILHFIFAYVVPNIRYFDLSSFATTHDGLSLLRRDKYRALNTATAAVLLAAFAMWRGYRSRLAGKIGEWARAMLERHRIIQRSGAINFWAVGLLIALAVVAWLASVRLGVFGYSAEAHSLAETRALRGWLKVGTDAGSLSLLILAIAIYSPRYRRNAFAWILFSLVLPWQIAVGFLSGFKSQVVMPFVTVGIACYTIRGRVSFRWAAAALLMLFVAYRVVGSFRDYRNQASGYDGTRIASIATAVVESNTGGPHRIPRAQQRAPAWQRLLGRQDLISFTAEAMAFEQERGTPRGAPDFLGSILWAPVNAYVPRALWPEKGVVSLGPWFNITVLGAWERSQTSVAMGPVGFLNFAGGFPMVFVGFLFIGGLQRVVWEAFRRTGIGGWIVYLSLLHGLVLLPSNVGGFLSGFLRQVPFSLLAQYLALRRDSRAAGARGARPSDA